MAEKVTRILHSQGLNRDEYDRLSRIAIPCGQVRADALGDIAAVWEAAKVPIKRAVRHRTRENRAEREYLYGLLK